jgi:hypothetical protein
MAARLGVAPRAGSTATGADPMAQAGRTGPRAAWVAQGAPARGRPVPGGRVPGSSSPAVSDRMVPATRCRWAPGTAWAQEPAGDLPAGPDGEDRGHPATMTRRAAWGAIAGPCPKHVSDRPAAIRSCGGCGHLPFGPRARWSRHGRDGHVKRVGRDGPTMRSAFARRWAVLPRVGSGDGPVHPQTLPREEPPPSAAWCLPAMRRAGPLLRQPRIRGERHDGRRRGVGGRTVGSRERLARERPDHQAGRRRS